MKTTLTCIECPMGCRIDVETDENNSILSITGNTCPRGEMYARNEITCPKRVITSTVRCADGRMVSVKTDRPVRKSEMFEIMKVINKLRPSAPIEVGDVIADGIDGEAKLVATSSAE